MLNIKKETFYFSIFDFKCDLDNRFLESLLFNLFSKFVF